MTSQNDMAFPFQDNGSTVVPQLGLTKREYFAAMAMQNMVHSVTSEMDKAHIEHCSKWMTSAAATMADALIAALNEKKGE